MIGSLVRVLIFILTFLEYVRAFVPVQDPQIPPFSAVFFELLASLLGLKLEQEVAVNIQVHQFLVEGVFALVIYSILIYSKFNLKFGIITTKSDMLIIKI